LVESCSFNKWSKFCRPFSISFDGIGRFQYSRPTLSQHLGLINWRESLLVEQAKSISQVYYSVSQRSYLLLLLISIAYHTQNASFTLMPYHPSLTLKSLGCVDFEAWIQSQGDGSENMNVYADIVDNGVTTCGTYLGIVPVSVPVSSGFMFLKCLPGYQATFQWSDPPTVWYVRSYQVVPMGCSRVLTTLGVMGHMGLVFGDATARAYIHPGIHQY